MKIRQALIAAALPLAALTAAGPARAQVVDMSALKCEDFLKSGKDAIAYIVIWLDGYHMDQDASPVMDFGKIAVKVEKFGEYCTKNGSATMKDAAEEVLK